MIQIEINAERRRRESLGPRHVSHLQVKLCDGAKKDECWWTGTPAACI